MALIIIMGLGVSLVMLAASPVIVHPLLLVSGFKLAPAIFWDLALAGKPEIVAGMTKSVGLLLMVIGGVLLYHGFSRKDSLVGDAAILGTRVANKLDGGTRVPEHAYYIAGGVALVAAGAWLTLRKST